MESSCIIIIYLHINRLTINPQNYLLPVGLIAQLVELVNAVIKFIHRRRRVASESNILL